MLVKIILLTLFSQYVFATSCDFFSEAMKNPDLAKNNAFWSEYSQKSNWTNQELEALKNKYLSSQGSAGSTSTIRSSSGNSDNSSSVSSSRSLRFDARAEKEIKVLPKDLHRKLDEFLSLIGTKEGSLELYKNAGSWAPEKRPDFGKNAHSVRLSGGYRVLYDLTPEGEVLIRRVNKGQTHRN